MTAGRPGFFFVAPELPAFLRKQRTRTIAARAVRDPALKA